MSDDKLILLCLDGADLERIKEYVAQGELPNFSSYLNDDRLGRVESTIPSNTSPAAFCIYTGCNPAKNGPVAMKKRDNETPYGRLDLNREQLWDYMEQLGKNFVVLDARFTAPVPQKGEAFTATYPKEDYYPDSLEEELRRYPDKHPRDMEVEDVREIGEVYLENIDTLDNEGLDFALFYIGVLDAVGHEHWDNDVLKEAYRQADRILGEVDKRADGLIVMSDHGFHQMPKYNVHVNKLLEDMGLIERSKISGLMDSVVPAVKRNIPDKYLRPIWDLMRKESAENEDKGSEETPFLSFEKKMPGVEWDETKAYCSCYFGIDVKSNVDITPVLQKLRDLEHEGEEVFVEVCRREDIYEGPFIERLPEILFVLNPKFRATHIFSKKLITRSEPDEGGQHEYARYGVFGVGEGLEMPEKTPTVYDIVPTTLAYFGFQTTNDIDGELLGIDNFGELESLESRLLDEIEI